MVRSFVERFLDPADWLGETLFGLIMVLSFTLGAGMIVADGPDATREMLRNVLGCNFAWSLIDAMNFVMTRIFERSRTCRLIEAVRNATTEEQGIEIIRAELEPTPDTVSSKQERTTLYRDIFRTVKDVAVPKTRIGSEELGGALVTFLLVMLTTVPAIVPFLVIADWHVALHVSNGLLLGMLFIVGYFWARKAKTNPWITGLVVMLIGAAMVGVAQAFGG